MNTPVQAGIALALMVVVSSCDHKLQQTASMHHAAIAIPYPNLKPEAEALKVSASTGGIVKTRNGSYIEVPPMAFVSATGSPIQDTVTLKMEEFHDAGSILLSGITMHYTDAQGKEQDFESAGMFQIAGQTSNGEAVHIAEGKSLRIDLASRQQDSAYQFYQLDTVRGNWVELSKAPVLQNTDSLVVVQRAMREAREAIKIPELPDPSQPVLDLDLDYRSYAFMRHYYGLAWQSATDQFDSKRLETEAWDAVNLVNTQASLDGFELELQQGKTKTRVPIRPVMTAAERNRFMLRIEAERKAQEQEAQRAALAMASTNQNVFYRSLSVNNFGIYNCDRPIVRNQPVTILANYIDPNGTEFKPSATYLISNNNSAVSQYSNQITVDATRRNMLVFTLPENRIAYIKADDIQLATNKALKGNTSGTEAKFLIEYAKNPLEKPEDINAILSQL
jgi:hypothetical protein